MYNRYIPQPDGSYRKNQISDPPPPPRPRPSPIPKQEPPIVSSAPEKHAPPPKPEPQKQDPPKQDPPISRQGSSAFSFLQQLLPKDLDTGDLLIVLLLLLMAGDSKEDKNTSLLTLALYLFM